MLQKRKFVWISLLNEVITLRLSKKYTEWFTIKIFNWDHLYDLIIHGV